MSANLAIDILRAAGGEVVQLPYNSEQQQVTRRLEQAGLIKSSYDNDQPTANITEAGKAFLRGPTVIPD